MKAGPRAISLIKSSESLYLLPYKCPAGYWTIGWGHLIKEGEHFTEITQQEAHDILLKDLEEVETVINNNVKVELDQNEFDALCSFVFNIGRRNFGDSTLLRMLNEVS